MASQTPMACADHKLQVTDKKEEAVKRVQRAQWLRAAILGANDGLLSTTSLMLGIGAAKEDQRSIVLSGLAGAIAGACSMAVGEFVSVSTQRDIESITVKAPNSKPTHNKDDDGADIKLQITTGASLALIGTKQPEANLSVSPVLTPSRKIPAGNLISESDYPCHPSSEKVSSLKNLATVLSPARSPMMKVMIAEARSNGMEDENQEDHKEDHELLPNPYKAAVVSAMAFLCGSLVPLLSAMVVSHSTIRILLIVLMASMAMALFGGLGAHLGGSPVRVSAGRVLVGGWISMAITYGLLKPLDKDHKGPDMG
ncbi:unnamed protein product [Ilex paraguariensis]|uniref:Uncharacterized protein n=1 Tax=Ilex paraguariensis TaxID=185542 RepID=A0ABC8SX60_9AQUA